MKDQRGQARKRSDPKQDGDPLWLRILQPLFLATLLLLTSFSFLAPNYSGRILWTVAIALLPLFIVTAGYHHWRRLCPLSFFAKLPSRFGYGGQRRAGKWLQNNYYLVAFGVFLFSLWMRLIATNGDGAAIGIFLIILMSSAVIVSLLFTGKSWCNYFCPVSFVEKIYTEPRGLRETPNSQCSKCTACKKTCPDINEENGYWKEILLPSKKWVYFAFPGVVFAFYFYYYLQAGSWDYYFGGNWTDEPGLIRTAFFPGGGAADAGLFFLQQIPRAVAAAATLLLGGALSLVLFTSAESAIGPGLRKKNLVEDESGTRHLFFSIAAFSAFTLFYSFAGAPTIRLVPGLPHLFQILVVAVATVFLLRRIGRKQRNFAEETLAKKIIGRWEWTDQSPPSDLREAYLIHTIRSESRAEAQSEMLEFYKEAVREAVEGGFASRSEIARLGSLRSKLHISEAEHERIMADLDEEDRMLLSREELQISPEKQLQLKTYGQALSVHLEQRLASGEPLEEDFIRGLREEYGVTEEEHTRVMERLLEQQDGIAGHVLDVPSSIEGLVEAWAQVQSAASPTGAFLARLLRQRQERLIESLFQSLELSRKASSEQLREGLLSDDVSAREASWESLGESLGPRGKERLLESFCSARNLQSVLVAPLSAVRIHLAGPDPYIRAGALHFLRASGNLDEAECTPLESDEHPLVRETATALRLREEGSSTGELLTIEKMVALGGVDLFRSLPPGELAALASASRQRDFEAGSVLCREGETGEEVFILLEGTVEIFRREDSHDHRIGIEGRGACIGELAVMDPAPRAATVRAGADGARTLSLDGGAFRSALSVSPGVSHGIIQTLARRLRGVQIRT